MNEPLLPENEFERLRDLKDLSLLDTPPEERFDRLTRIAKNYFSVDICLVTLIDENRQWFKSNQGFGLNEIPRDISFCQHTILSATPLIVEDTLLDPRFIDNPLVSGPSPLRFYAGVPLIGINNFRIGTFCIYDCKPRKLNSNDLSSLLDFTRLIQSEIFSVTNEDLKQKFKEGDSKLRAIIDNVVDGIITIDEKGIVETLNPAAVRLFGYCEEEVIGNNVKMLMPDGYKYSHDDYLKQYRDTGVAKIIGTGREVTGRRKDGSTFPIDIAVSEMILKGKRGFTGIVRDISQRKMQEEIQEKFATIVKSSNDAIVSYKPDGCITSWNLAAEKMFGYSQDNIVGKKYSVLVPESRKSEHDDVFDKLKSGENFKHHETQRLTKAGKLVDVSISISPITNKDGTLVEISAIFRDISDQKKWTKELVRAKEEAEQASHSKTQFVANMSHEIRTPLNTILGMSRLIAKSKLTQEQKNYLNMIQSSGKFLLGIINDILDFSKVEAGKMELSLSEFTLSDMMRSVANVMSVNTGDKNLELVIDIDSNTPNNFKGDIQRIQQILTNLVSNSIKFTEAGEVVVSVSSKKLNSGQHQLLFTVEDTGIGIDEEQQKHLFSAFSQADNSITRIYGGSGLGLAISKRFVELMGGNIQVVSALGKGTKITVEFPILLSQKSTKKNKNVGRLSNLNLLIIDDNEASRKAIVRAIETIGWRAEVLTSGSNLTAWLNKQFESGIHYDFMLIDNTLPGESSLHILREIETDFTHYSLPSALMSNAFSPDQMQQFKLLENYQNNLIKPITTSSLFDCVCENSYQKMGVTDTEEKQINNNHLQGIHVLLVEDNAMNQMVAQCMLEDCGATSDVANNGKEAIKMLSGKNCNYDIILMDVQMPVMDGFTATKIIRQEMHLDIPVLALSAGVLSSERKSCSEAGMNDFVAKPIDADALYMTIDRHLPSHESHP